MLTRRGWLLVGAAVVLLVAGRILGLVELYVTATASAVAVVAALCYVRVVPFGLDATRAVRPARVHHGAACRAELALVNSSRRRTPELVAEESFDHGRLEARFTVPRLEPGQTGRAAYRVPTDRRGRFPVGPLRLRLEDPFGLAWASAPAGRAGSVLVYPRVDPVAGLPPAPGHDPHAGSFERAARLQGEEFYALRPYEVGDDLRRVHWPATARSGELVIRQLELPWQHRVTVVLDVRRAVQTADSFEIAVSAAASILTGSHRDGALVRLLTTAGLDSGFGGDAGHWEASMGVLAGVRVTGAANLSRTLARLRRHGSGSAVAVVSSGALAAADVRAVARLRETVGVVVLVLVDRSAYQPGVGPAPAPVAPARLPVVRITAERPLPLAWGAVARLTPAGLR